ncbi:MAG: type II toxin-antitoxin system RelE/ParE family toxin [Deltaproteobacteria bacterium]|nr:type II toxin-antitoxin system RelE/ParE family toxin [Deltaproteobacteria bacterium]
MARPRVETHPDAISEARAAYLWYAERNPTAGGGFMAALDQAVSQILESPDRWTRHLHGTRKYLLRRFPYSVIYRVTANAVQIVAVAHGRRRPGYWKRRQF